ncbi:MAG: hypothetical protein MN733_39280, partial [Nitrososphaera sp.]|nr:hypothetical protein [Nitrososphaera sp.]
VTGKNLSDLGGGKDAEIVEFIEGALVYRLVWAMEAVRVRRAATCEAQDFSNEGRAALAVETGTSNLSAGLLIQSGLSSRIAALQALSDCPADFDDLRGLKQWLRSAPVKSHEGDENWPTAETASIWRAFVDGLRTTDLAKWESQHFEVPVQWIQSSPNDGSYVRLLYDAHSKSMQIRSTTLEPLGTLPHKWNSEPEGLILAKVLDDSGYLALSYLGPKDLFSHAPESET